ncbi:MAG: arginase family protein, partial [Alphaproteobacteria bacterium]|nr:arginase family protein [Alphaproteobacteria bacterium]
LQTESDWTDTVREIRRKIGTRPFVVSFDFDVIDPTVFRDVWVPEPNGISLDAAKYFVSEFSDADDFEFVEYAPSGDEKSAQIVHDLISIVVND